MVWSLCFALPLPMCGGLRAQPSHRPDLGREGRGGEGSRIPQGRGQPAAESVRGLAAAHRISRAAVRTREERTGKRERGEKKKRYSGERRGEERKRGKFKVGRKEREGGYFYMWLS